MAQENLAHPVSCRCGAFKAQITGTGVSSRVICYCRDCQAFARFLGNQATQLDQAGGSDIVQVAHHRLQIQQGAEQLAILRLSPQGLLRWYTRCCQTALGNTLADARGCFIGLLHSSLDASRLHSDFGAPIAALATHSATLSPAPRQYGLPKVLWNFAKLVLHSRASGAYTRSDLFNPATTGLVVPRVLSLAERQAVSQPSSIQASN